MSDLILSTRLAALKSNLSTVQEVLTTVEGQRDELIRLEQLLLDRGDSVSASLRILDRLIMPIEQEVRDLVYDNQIDRSVLNQVEDAIAELRHARDLLGRAAGLLEGRRNRLIDILPESRLHDYFKGTLVAKASSSVDGLNEFQKSLVELMQQSAAELAQAETASDAEQQQHLNRARELSQKAWKQYREKRLEEYRPIFTDYVDFLRGLAVRDVGFDEGVCQLADELMSDNVFLVPIYWESFTVLSRDESVGKTHAKIIRLPFPEWTIWALPLVAHEVGLLISERSLSDWMASDERIDGVPVKDFVESHTGNTWPIGALHDCLADAFATFAMGPAYAFATILLRFDPVDAYVNIADQASHAKRAAVVLEMLRHMDATAEFSQYAGIVSLLEEAWQEALDQASPQKELGAEEKLLIPRIVAWQAHKLQEDRRPGFSASDMERIADWPGLLQDDDPVIEPRAKDFRAVLNAAWISRLDYPDRVDVIERNAKSLWRRMTDHRAGRPSRGVQRAMAPSTSPKSAERLGDRQRPPEEKGGREPSSQDLAPRADRQRLDDSLGRSARL